MDTLCNLIYTLLCFREEKSDFADRNEANTELLLIEGIRMIFHKKRTVKSGIFQKYRLRYSWNNKHTNKGNDSATVGFHIIC